MAIFESSDGKSLVAHRKIVLVLHLAGQIPFAGIAWQALHYVLGFRRLGYDAWYIEDSRAYTYDPKTQSITNDCSYSVGFLKSTMERFGLSDRWAFLDAANDVVFGVSKEELRILYGNADALFNLCGATRLREEHLTCPIRAFIDTDPGFEQIRLASGHHDSVSYLGMHTHHFTYGENLGNDDCLIPTVKCSWLKTRPPVLIDLWNCGGGPVGQFFTSIATWENKGKDVYLGDQNYRWSKHVNFLRFLEIPNQVAGPFRLAISPPTPLVATKLREAGWDIVDPAPISADTRAYREFIAASYAEFTVAKDIYVRPRSGWFSDRSVCYLAAGRPVITQETGFSKFIETGRGLFSFASIEEIREAVLRIKTDYSHQSASARTIAAEFFNADVVLRKLARDCGI